MANHATSMNFSRWDAAVADCDAAQAASAAIKDHPQGRVRNDVVWLAAEAEERLHRVPAPTLGALKRKLHLLFDLSNDAYGTDFMRTVVGDLTRLELLLVGVDPYEASGGMDLGKVAADFTDAAREYDHCLQLYCEGRSDAWVTGSRSDVTALMEEAEAKLLSLSAPNLTAVAMKLTILFGDNRFCEIDDACVHALILRDLRRFVHKHRQ